MVDQQHPQAALAGLRGAEQTGRTGANHDGIKIYSQNRLWRLLAVRCQLLIQE